MDKPVCIQDFEKIAKNKLSKTAFDYYVSGSNEEQTLNDNCNAFKRYRFRPRVLQDVSEVNTTANILGHNISFPLCVAPTAMNKMAHPEGELAVFGAASKMNIGYTLSTWATTSIEEISEAASNTSSPRWMQLYIYKDRNLTKTLVNRAEKAGFCGLFVTVDTPILGKRYQDVRNDFTLPTHLSLVNIGVKEKTSMHESKGSALANHVRNDIDSTLTWSDISWLRGITKMPIIIKGILTGEMAKEAVKYGVDGIVVSNHGARQLDGVPATIDALKEVVEAVGDAKCEVYMDGGVRNGSDIFKAVALGAKAVFIGRPVLWGLAYQGESGVAQVLKIFKEEFESCMKLMGCRSIEEIRQGKDLVVYESYFKSHL